jgi:hypothetical protein
MTTLNIENLQITENESIFEASAIFTNEADRNDFIAQFPKSVGVYGTTLYTLENEIKPIACIRVVLSANKVSGEVNETGLKRIAKFKQIAKVGA